MPLWVMLFQYLSYRDLRKKMLLFQMEMVFYEMFLSMTLQLPSVQQSHEEVSGAQGIMQGIWWVTILRVGDYSTVDVAECWMNCLWEILTVFWLRKRDFKLCDWVNKSCRRQGCLLIKKSTRTVCFDQDLGGGQFGQDQSGR